MPLTPKQKSGIGIAAGVLLLGGGIAAIIIHNKNASEKSAQDGSVSGTPTTYTKPDGSIGQATYVTNPDGTVTITRDDGTISTITPSKIGGSRGGGLSSAYSFIPVHIGVARGGNFDGRPFA